MKAILEGLLFVVGDDGLSIEDISNILDIDIDTTKELVLSLKKDYESNERGIRIDYFANKLKLTTKIEHKEYYTKLLETTTNELSYAALEVLAVIVYNEPITRVDVDKIRGVSSIQIVRKLVARGLIKPCGKSNDIGHPMLYKVTDEFYDYFGIKDKSELPKITVEEEGEKDLFLSKYKE